MYTVQAQKLTIISQDYEKAKAESRLQQSIVMI